MSRRMALPAISIRNYAAYRLNCTVMNQAVLTRRILFCNVFKERAEGKNRAGPVLRFVICGFGLDGKNKE